ncbi:MAG: fumarylacetoacetate hydrolase family protein [Sphingobium sp.]
MRLVRFTVGGDPLIGRVIDDRVVSLSARIPNIPLDMVDLITNWSEFSNAIDSVGKDTDYALADVKLLAPVARPGKIFCMGLNYADHVQEANLQTPEHQVWFSKAVTTVNGPFDPIERPVVSDTLDYEAELVFVVGKRCKHVSAEDAAKVIFGYCIGNDVSVRAWQRLTPQWMMGKTFDTHAPFGPFIVTSDEIDPKNLGIRSLVNGETRQDSNTKNLIFDCAAQVAFLSQAMTLEPGDIVFTGTPGGVGSLMKPPQFLKPGDRVRVEIDGIGFIENEVVDERTIEGDL